MTCSAFISFSFSSSVFSLTHGLVGKAYTAVICFAGAGYQLFLGPILFLPNEVVLGVVERQV